MAYYSCSNELPLTTQLKERKGSTEFEEKSCIMIIQNRPVKPESQTKDQLQEPNVHVFCFFQTLPINLCSFLKIMLDHVNVTMTTLSLAQVGIFRARHAIYVALQDKEHMSRNLCRWLKVLTLVSN